MAQRESGSRRHDETSQENDKSIRINSTTRLRENVPQELLDARRWVTWRYKLRGDGSDVGRWTKPPDQAVNAPGKWLSFDGAVELAAKNRARGVGYVLGDGLVGIDLDNVRERDAIVGDALALGSYCEVSPSLRGLHVLIRGTIARNRNIRARHGEPGREIYASGRYFTVTGKRIGEATAIASGSKAQRLLVRFYATWFPDDGR